MDDLETNSPEEMFFGVKPYNYHDLIIIEKHLDLRKHLVCCGIRPDQVEAIYELLEKRNGEDPNLYWVRYILLELEADDEDDEELAKLIVSGKEATFYSGRLGLG